MFFKKKKINSDGNERKERSDKKVHVGPTVSINLKSEIERLAYIADQPVKSIAEFICYYGIRHADMSRFLGDYVQKGILRVNSTLYIGSDVKPSLSERTDSDPTDRISIRFPQEEYEKYISMLAYHLDVSPTRATAILLEYGIKHHEVIETILARHSNRNIDEVMNHEEMKKFMKYINRNNPFKSSWNENLLQFIHTTKQTTKRIRKKITDKMIDKETYKWDLNDLD
ncbi:hypothetical protein M3152_08320 [Sporosarcina luteola]|uniref:hypothetical protein n=1 Tax=Sporosarcina luteola TaxID=582850 RepID=UPI00203FC802|nr:hypothetical protein [Sporosarcina luteola]MCM3637725.1 hypothetical protein [Sporosarcina luteola]